MCTNFGNLGFLNKEGEMTHALRKEGPESEIKEVCWDERASIDSPIFHDCNT
jgi:hypothetical protein